jgi:hypothetical protein
LSEHLGIALKFLTSLGIGLLLGGHELVKYCAPSLLASAAGVAIGLVLFV